MDAIKYLTTIAKICDTYIKDNICDFCPLNDLECGIPTTESEINKVVKFVENYNEEDYDLNYYWQPPKSNDEK
ncbi:MAG: hypothetical protein ABFD00_04990 [Chloroherpetonaceae bacterium]